MYLNLRQAICVHFVTKRKRRMNIYFLHAKKYALFGQNAVKCLMFNLPDIKDI